MIQVEASLSSIFRTVGKHVLSARRAVFGGAGGSARAAGGHQARRLSRASLSLHGFFWRVTDVKAGMYSTRTKIWFSV
jgi:hypothetical protein